MKNMKRIISLLMTLMLICSSVTANADVMISSSAGIQLQTESSAVNADLGNFLVDASIIDISTGQEVTTVEVNKNYKIRVDFKEGNRENQFQVNDNKQMIYQFPNGLEINNLTGQYPVTINGIKIGVYTISGNTLTFTPWYSKDEKEYAPYDPNTMDDVNYKTYADWATNTELWFDVIGKFTKEQKDFKFKETVEKKWDIVPKVEKPEIDLSKKGEYDKENNKIHYTINAKVTNADTDELTITDTLGNMLGLMGIDSNSLKITKKIGDAAADYTLDAPKGETLNWTEKETTDKRYKAGFTMKLKDVKQNDEFIIEYDAPIDTAELEKELGSRDVNLTIGHNKVTASTKDTTTQIDWWGESFPGKKQIQKQYVGQPENDKSILKWKLTIGSKNETDTNKKINGGKVTDKWTFDTSKITSVSLDKTAGVKITLYPFGNGEPQVITLTENEVSQYLTENADGTGFTFTVPNPAFDVKYCEVEYQTDCTMKDEGEGGTSSVTGEVENKADYNGQTDGDKGTAGGEKPLPELEPHKELVESNSKELVFRYTVVIPKEYIGKESIWFKDEFALNDEYKKYLIYNNPNLDTLKVTARGNNDEKTIDRKIGEYGYQFVSKANEGMFYLYFNATNAEDPSLNCDVWNWPKDEDVTLTIEYSISKKELVQDTAYGGTKYPDNFGKQIGEWTRGQLINTGTINGKSSTAEIDITRSIIKNVENIDTDRGIVTYTVDINKTGVNQIPLNAIFTDDYDKHMEFVPGSLHVYVTRENGGWPQNIAEVKYTGEYLDKANNQITLNFGDSSWEIEEEIFAYPIQERYGSEDAFRKAVQDGNWYRYEYINSLGYPWIRIEYKLRLKDEYVDGQSYRVNNTARLADWNSASASATVKPKHLDKSMTVDGGLLLFTINVNPSGMKMLTGDEGKLTLTDEMTNLSPIMDSSFQVINTKTETALKKGTDWDVEYDAEKHKMTFTLPDETPLKIQYHARAIGTGQIDVSNTATLLAESSSTSKNGFDASDTSGGANQSKFGVQLNKVQIGTTKGLEGAEFKITYFHKTETKIEERDFGTYKTNEFGVAQIDQGNHTSLGEDKHVYANTVYRIVETKAPNGYEASGQEWYIYIASDKEDKNSIDVIKASLERQGKIVTSCANWDTITIENSPTTEKYSFSFTKTDSDGNALSGATFMLTDTDKEKTEDVRTATSDEDGKVSFTDLKPGKTYLLEETRAPGGYLLSTVKWTIEVGENGEITVKDEKDDPVLAIDKGYQFANREMPTLPSVGGQGTAVYSLLGLALMAMATAAAYTLTRRKRARRAE